VREGKVYVGGVCDAQASQNKADLEATVYAFDPQASSFVSVFDFPLTYPKGTPFGGDILPADNGWFPWSDDYITVSNRGSYPGPVLSDIEFDIDGSMVLGFLNRDALQVGWLEVGPDGTVNPRGFVGPNSWVYPGATGSSNLQFAAGDILRATV
jgi:hypothetical protein